MRAPALEVDPGAKHAVRAFQASAHVRGADATEQAIDAQHGDGAVPSLGHADDSGGGLDEQSMRDDAEHRCQYSAADLALLRAPNLYSTYLGNSAAEQS